MTADFKNRVSAGRLRRTAQDGQATNASVSSPDRTIGHMTWQQRAEAWRTRCYEWRDRYLDRTKIHLRLVEYCDQTDADIDGVKRILSGAKDYGSREAG